MQVHSFAAGHYRCIPGGPFSLGVAPERGFALHRARFHRPPPLMDGFDAIEAHLARLGLPKTALAACELRAPKPMTMAEFQAFNAPYVARLAAMGLNDAGISVTGRSNVAPILEAPAEPVFFAFTYVVPEAGAAGDFLISGKPENVDGATGAERVFGGNDVSIPGLARKARYMVDVLKARVAALGCDWGGVTAAQMYCVHDIRPLFESVLAPEGLTSFGLAWFPAWPPVSDMHIEADVRRVRAELVI